MDQDDSDRLAECHGEIDKIIDDLTLSDPAHVPVAEIVERLRGIQNLLEHLMGTIGGSDK